LTTSVHREAFDDFYDAFREVGGREGWRSGEALRHFLESAYLAVRGQTLPRGGDAWQKNEDEFLKIESGWRDAARTKADLGRMLGAMTLALSREPVDFVGPVFNEIAADAGMGQFFTPHDVSLMIARMIFGSTRDEILDGKSYITIAEPACGVGGMILAACVALRDVGIDCARETHWHAIDIDARAFHACYLQLALTDVSAFVFHGNALSLEARRSAVTPAAILYPKDPGATARAVIPPPTQLSLL
jgi:hypothetical protein